MSLTDIGQVCRVHNVSPAGHASLTAFSEGKVGHSYMLVNRRRRIPDEQCSPSLSSQKTVQPDKYWLVISTGNITIAPQCGQIV
jgi:hypothetical protein